MAANALPLDKGETDPDALGMRGTPGPVSGGTVPDRPWEYGPVPGPDPEHVPGCHIVLCADGLTARLMILLEGAEKSSGALPRGAFP
ncbi:hypothetical protein BG452_03050 [Streptomyces sp. CBMA123]|nr:hypothetical protein [Streptomyces sp. CBMA123]